MSDVFELPDLGEGLQEAEIVAWHVGVGDHVVTDQPLLSVETDKALVEVPAPRAGRIARLYGAPGDIVPVGAPLIEFATGEAEDRGAIVGELGSPGEPVAPIRQSHQGLHAKAAPAVRRMAQSLGVDLESITPTGPDGTITKADVEAALSPTGTKLRGVRRSMLLSMERAGREAVRATVTDEADISSWREGTDTTVRLVRAVCAACAASPSLNAWFDSTTQTFTLHEHVDLGIAVETEEGLFAPVLRNAGALDSASVRDEIERIKSATASRAMPREDLLDPTISLSNFGMHGGRFAELVIVPPQVAIFGAGRARDRAVAIDGKLAVRKLIPLSLSFDHRVATGVEATRFLNAAIADLERQE